MLDWAALFVPTAPILELFVRGTVTFLVLFAFLRVVGQREAGGLGMSDLHLAYLEPSGMISVIRADGDQPDIPTQPPT